MKRILSVMMFCSLLLVIAVGTTYGQAYSRISYATVEQPVIDGEWTTPTEWVDGMQTNATANFVFRSTWDTIGTYGEAGFSAITRWIVEVLDDTTDDDADYLVMCLDGDQSGGTAPAVGDFKLVIEGDGTLSFYQGTGSAWEVATPDTGAIVFSTTVNDSPVSSTAHRIYEFNINKSATNPALGIQWNFRLAAVDDSGSGEQMWPPASDADVPDGWGMEDYSSDTIPEGFTFTVMVVLSSISLIVGSRYLQKRSTKKEQ